jgi:hypothetical protein
MSGCGQLTGETLVSVTDMTTQFTTGQVRQAELFRQLQASRATAPRSRGTRILPDEVAKAGNSMDQGFFIQELHGPARRPPGRPTLTAQDRDRWNPAPGRQLTRRDLLPHERGEPHVLARIRARDHLHTTILDEHYCN